jgi:hypothetical protein
VPWPSGRILWAALALAATGLCGLAGCGSREEEAGRAPADASLASPDAAPAAPSLPEDEAARLGRLGYASGYREAEGSGGVSIDDPARTWPGLNLYTSGDAPTARLVDMRGEPVHRWQVAYRDAFPGASADALARPGTRSLRRVHLFENGDLLAIFDYFGLVRLDRASRVLWALPIPAHHDLDARDDRIWVLSEEIHEIARLRPGRRVREDLILVLDGAGRELRRVSILRALERSRWARLLARIPPHDDLLHTNTLAILDGSHAGRIDAFRSGNALVSLRNLDLVAVVDLEREEIVWALEGGWHLQHDPSLVAHGNLLLFDNLGLRGRSRVLELDPQSGGVVWSWAGPGAGFTSQGMGGAQRLPNGNTIVTDSFGGRVFEVAPDGAVVWRFENPARTGPRGDRVAVVPELQRIDPAAVASWLDAASAGR